MTATPERDTVLVLRALGLGDFLAAVPAYRGLRRAFPDHELVLAAPAALAPLARLTGAIDTMLDTRGLAPLPALARRPAIAVNLHGRGPQSHRLLDALDPLHRIGFRSGAWTGPEWTDEEHEVDRWCRLLAATGIQRTPPTCCCRRLAPCQRPPTWSWCIPARHTAAGAGRPTGSPRSRGVSPSGASGW